MNKSSGIHQVSEKKSALDTSGDEFKTLAEVLNRFMLKSRCRGEEKDCLLLKQEVRQLEKKCRSSKACPGEQNKASNSTEYDATEKKFHRLTRKLFNAREEDRKKLFLYLHDSLAQDLSTLKIGLELFFTEHIKEIPELKKGAGEMMSMLQQIIQSVREVACDLHPSILKNLGLVQGIRQFCMKYSEKTGIDIVFQAAGFEKTELDFDMNIQLYRLVQEILNSDEISSNAAQVIIKMTASSPSIILRIEHDGSGLDLSETAGQPDGYRDGWDEIRERIQLMNAVMTIDTNSEKKIRMYMEIPFKDAGHVDRVPHPPVQRLLMEQMRLFQ